MQRALSPRLILRLVRGPCRSVTSRLSVIHSYFRHYNKMSYSIIERGQANTLDYRVFFKSPNGEVVSPFHDIPLYANEEKTILNMVVEIPRWTNAKMEICKEEKLNPIKQDVKNGKPRFVKNIFPHHGYIWNYGALPQTWEDPKIAFPETNTKGDNDPLDVCEIGHKIHSRGAVIQVKVLGTMLLIDEGETDWKVLAIDVTDPMAEKLNDVEDIKREMPGFLRASYEWFRYYKKPDGKPENVVHWNGECKGKEFALKIVDEAHEQWKKLVSDPMASGSISRINTTNVSGDPDSIQAPEALVIVQKTTASVDPPAEVSQEVNQWHYVIPQ